MQLKLLFERPPVQADDVQADEPGRVSVSIGHLEMVDRQIRQAPATATAEICLELDWTWKLCPAKPARPLMSSRPRHPVFGSWA